MTSLFKTAGSATQASQPSALSGLNLQSSGYGKPLGIVLGATRVAPQLTWYGEFQAFPQNSQQASGGGKGGMFNQGGGTTSNTTTYIYAASFILTLCEGPIGGVGNVYINKSITSLQSAGFSLLLGTYPQAAWPHLAVNFPADAFPYTGVAYVAAANYNLGASPNLPGHNFEVFGPLTGSTPINAYDADASQVVQQLLTNVHWGASGFSYLGDVSDYQAYTIATGLAISVQYTSQTALNSTLGDIAKVTNSEFVWSGKTLRIVPYGDQPIVGNQFAWNPPPIQYNLTDDDFLPTSGGTGSGSSSSDSPILITRKAPSDSLNRIVMECLDRSNQYNICPIEAKDQADIDQYGIRDNGSQSAHMFCDTSIAQIACQLMLQRQSVSNTYCWSTDYRYLRLDCMDFVTLTHAGQGLSQVQVRIIDIVENDDDTFTFTAEEVLDGLGTPAIHSFQQSQGFAANYNIDPGNCEIPLIFEPTDELGNGLEVWLATAGGPNWGGCEVWISTDEITYGRVAKKFGPSTYGKTTSLLDNLTKNVSGPTVDNVGILGVDISASDTKLTGGTVNDALNLVTLCYVGGEYVSYQIATLTGTGQYNLRYLVRGALGTGIPAHQIGENFARLDEGITKIEYRQDQIGQTVYIKLLSFDIYGGNQQSLAEVAPYPYTITGVALTSPLPVVQNLRTVFNDGFMEFWWDDVVDFRNGVRYQIFKGPTFAGAQQVGDNAHAPFKTFGNDVYWVQAYCQPLANLFVFSEQPASVTIAGNMIISNLVQTSDQQAEGWPGIFSNGVAITGSNIRLGSSGNILTDPDFLNTLDILDYGGIIALGTYEIDTADYVNVHYVAQAYISASWKALGVPVGANVLTVNDFLAMPDVLGSASTAFISAKVQVAISQVVNTDIFTPTDVFDTTNVPDAFGISYVWSAWQDYAPGVYTGQAFKFRLVLGTTDPQTITEALAFSYSISVKPRVDHYQNLNVTTGGLTINFVPDNSGTGLAQPFNGGPPTGPANNSPTLFTAFEWSGSPTAQYVIDSLNLSHLTFHFVDQANNPIAVNGVNVQVEGY